MKFDTDKCEIIQIGKTPITLPKSEIHEETIAEFTLRKIT